MAKANKCDPDLPPKKIVNTSVMETACAVLMEGDVEMKPTQCEQVLEYMKQFGSITQLEALRDIGCMRLASRISDLRYQGYAIGRRMKTGKNRYGKDISFAEYYLI